MADRAVLRVPAGTRIKAPHEKGRASARQLLAYAGGDAAPEVELIFCAANLKTLRIVLNPNTGDYHVAEVDHVDITPRTEA